MNYLFSKLFELFYYDPSFSDDLYKEQLYTTLGIVDLLLSLFFVVLFYYIINRPSFSKWYHWLGILALNTATTFGVGIFVPKSKFVALDLEYSAAYYYLFGFRNALISILLFILISFCIRWWSTNAKSTPFPN